MDKYGIKNKAHSWFKSYLYDHTQCSLVNGNLSNCANVRVGVPQGTVLGPILFLLFMNDLPIHVENVTLFADDTMIDVRGNTVDEVIILLQAEIDKLVNWFYMNKLTLNVKKSCSMLIGTPQKINNHYKDSLGLIISGEILCNKSSYTYLGLIIDSCMTWDYAVSNTCKKIGTHISVMQKLNNVIPNIHANMLYYAFIQPYFDYGLTVWGNTSVINIDKLQRLQNRIARVMCSNFNYDVDGLSIVKELNWLNVRERKTYLECILMYKCVNGLAPSYLTDYFTQSSHFHNYSTRHALNGRLHLPKPRTEYFKRSLMYKGPQLWNVLPQELINANISLNSFKWKVKQYIRGEHNLNL